MASGARKACGRARAQAARGGKRGGHGDGTLMRGETLGYGDALPATIVSAKAGRAAHDGALMIIPQFLILTTQESRDISIGLLFIQVYTSNRIPYEFIEQEALYPNFYRVRVCI